MTPPTVSPLSWCALAVYAFAFALIAPAQESNRNAILILDASGSMWGQVEGRPKIEIARDSVASVVNNLPPNTRLGLMAYGHRQKGDCADIELLLPPKELDRAAFLEKVNSIVPKGKTPLTDSVRLAAESLKLSEAPASVILVTDGIETCYGDPCALAKELANTGIDFDAHVIAFDLASQEAASIRCLADETGGLFLEAGDSAALERSLQSTLQALKEQPSGASFRAMNATTGEVMSGATWKIQDTTKEKEVGTLSTPTGNANLAPGDYVAIATWTDKSKEITFSVSKGKQTPVEISFGPGTLRLAAAESRDSEPIDRHLNWKIYTLGENGETSDEPVVSKHARQPEIQLEGGTYRVTVDYGKATAQKDVILEDGAIENVLLFTGSGTISVRSERDGVASEEHRSYFVFPIGADGKPAGEKLTSSHAIVATFNIPAGKYLITAEDGPIKASKEIEISAGEKEDVVLNFGTGTVTVSATRGGEPLTTHRTFSIFTASEPDGKAVEKGHAISKEFILGPGDYIVRSEDGTQTVEDQFTIESGGSTEVVLNFTTGTVTVSATRAEEPLKDHRTFSIYREGETDGKAVEKGHAISKEFILDPGNYVVMAEDGPQVVEQPFSIETGGKSTVVLNFTTGLITISATQGGKPVETHGTISVHTADSSERIEASYAISKQFALSPGTYQVGFDSKDAKGTAEITVITGDDKEVVIPISPK
ncbi:MAG: hypothetical protein CMO55_26405 [Verrucomicrobiales bacterium]|nr:hypothetical protein [Verrucomicrobiales bacterium]